MTFDLSPDQETARDSARAFAVEQLQPHATQIDHDGNIPAELLGKAATLLRGDAMTTIVAVEELASVVPAVALTAAGQSGHALGLTGLRGATTPVAGARTHLVLAAVALGIGKAALGMALAELKRATAVAGATVEKPHWVVSDAATELEAARLMTYQAAHTNTDADIALARLLATAAAQRVIDAALRVTGPTGLQQGSVLERLSRDARAVSLIGGTEEDQRALAAEGLLPL